MRATTENVESIGRLLRRADFLRLQKSGRKWVSGGVIVQVAEAPATAKTRFGLVVSKKLDKRAVGRNRMRRRLRAAAYEVLAAAAPTGLDVVLIGRHQTADYDFEALCRDIKWCLKKLAAQKEESRESHSSPLPAPL